MPLDPSIPMSVRPPQLESPLSAFAQILQIQNVQQTLQENALKLRQQEIAARDDQALRLAVQKHSAPGKPVDLYAVADTLAAGGFAPMAFKVRETAITQQQKWAESRIQQMDSLDKDLTMATRIAKGMKDRSIPFTQGATAIAALGRGWESELGTEYDEQRLTDLIAYGETAAGSIKYQQDAIKNGQEALRLTNEALRDRNVAASNAPLIFERWSRSIGNAILAAESERDWQRVRTMAESSGPVAQGIIRNLPTDLAAAKKQALVLATTPKERADIRNMEETRRQEGQRIGIAQGHLKVAQDQLAIDRDRLKLLRDQWGKDPSNDANTKEVAKMVVRSPELLKEMNPVMKGQVLRAIAASDDLELKTTRQRLTEDTIQGAYQTIQELKNMKGMAGAIGAPSISEPGSLTRMIPGVGPMAGSDPATFTQYLETLKSQMTLGKMDLMRGMGHASDRDVKILMDSVTALSPKLSEEQFLKELEKQEAALGRMAARYTEKEGRSLSLGFADERIGKQVNLPGVGIVTITKINADGTFEWKK